MAYRADLKPRARAAALIAVAGLHAGLALLLMELAVKVTDRIPAPPFHSFDIDLPVPPPEVEVDVQKPASETLREEGAEAAANSDSLSTPIVLPDALVELPPTQPVMASATPDIGFNTMRGSADRAGMGAGAGGSATGTGSGSTGDGAGAGGGTRVAVIERTKLKFGDYSRNSRRAWRDASRVMVVVMVQTNGRATGCEVKVSSGDKDIDAETCRLVERKVRFHPALDAQGQPYATPFGYVQYDIPRH